MKISASLCMAGFLAIAAMPVANLVLPVADAVAEPKKPPSKEKMLRRCDQKALTCEQDCDSKQLAGDLTDEEYKSCNDKCESRFKKCVRNVEDARPARTTGGGGDPDGDDGLLLSPD